ncbi:MULTISPECIES: DUF6985 domain-containing protein [Rhizobium]
MRKWGPLHPLLRFGTASGPDRSPSGRAGGDDDNWYVVMEAECAWDAEDGIMLVWRNGTTLSKVGPYNGHLTNKNAYGGETLRDVVYKVRNTEYMTRIVELVSR